jgi:hypothetical protein
MEINKLHIHVESLCDDLAMQDTGTKTYYAADVEDVQRD